MHRTLNGAVTGGLKHGEQGPALAVAQAQAGLAPGQRSLEHHPGLCWTRRCSPLRVPAWAGGRR